MSHLITSSGKGAPFTPVEADGNLSLLETRTGDGWAITSDLHIEVDRHATINRTPNFYV
jgi:hypothetical protein